MHSTVFDAVIADARSADSWFIFASCGCREFGFLVVFRLAVFVFLLSVSFAAVVSVVVFLIVLFAWFGCDISCCA